MTNKTWSQIKSWMQLTFIVSVNQIENNNKKNSTSLESRWSCISVIYTVVKCVVGRCQSCFFTLANANPVRFSGGVNGSHILMKRWKSCHSLHSVERYLHQQTRKLQFLLSGRTLDRVMSGKYIFVNASKINLDLCQCFFLKCVKPSYVNLKCTSWKKYWKKKKRRKK